jgi:hypothetical protein
MPAQQIFLINFKGKVKAFCRSGPWLAIYHYPSKPLFSLFLIKIKIPFKLISGTSDRVVKFGWYRRFHMTWKDDSKKRMVNCFRFIPPGLITFLLLTSMAYAQSAREDRRLSSLHIDAKFQRFEQSSDRSQVAQQAPSGFNESLVDKISASRLGQNHPQSPLPPVSAFSLQTNLCKYLDTWPTPGATVSQDGPSDEELTDDDLM